MDSPDHVLSKKSVRQRRNVFVWCGNCGRQGIGWRVDKDLPVTISTAYRWVTAATQAKYGSKDPEVVALFPVVVRPAWVLMYAVVPNGLALSPESQELIVPGDYGIFTPDGVRPMSSYNFVTHRSYSSLQRGFELNSAALASKAFLTSTLTQQALDRDGQCFFSGDRNPDSLIATWIFPPFLGYTLSDNTWLANEYRENPDAIDLSEFMAVPNVISGHKDVVALFWDNKLGVDVDDNYRIVCFEGSEHMNGGIPLKSHLNLVDGPYRPSDQFLRLHFELCLAVSACGGDVTEDYGEHEIELFMDDLGVYDDEIDTTDPRWSTSLGFEVHSYILREKLAPYAEETIAL